MHDDQHGTAIISGAGLLNALDIQGKKIEEAKLVVNGAGAAASSCTKLYMGLGIKKENMDLMTHFDVVAFAGMIESWLLGEIDRTPEELIAFADTVL